MKLVCPPRLLQRPSCVEFNHTASYVGCCRSVTPNLLFFFMRRITCKDNTRHCVNQTPLCCQPAISSRGLPLAFRMKDTYWRVYVQEECVIMTLYVDLTILLALLRLLAPCYVANQISKLIIQQLKITKRDKTRSNRNTRRNTQNSRYKLSTHKNVTDYFTVRS